jgi:formamidopyrimidine-DNA glycosylase
VAVPELPEVESARAVVERAALHRRIVEVDDTDSWVCRPHVPGEVRAALLGRELAAVRRQGKSMWCLVSGEPDLRLGIHLGMSGRILVTGPGDSGRVEGGDWWGASEPATQPQWYRFSLTFADGGRLRLADKRRLGRVRLNPDLSQLGPDAESISREEFRRRVGRGTAPVKARLLDQSVLAGVGNLLADETLWQARLSPVRPAGGVSVEELDLLHTSLRRSIQSAISQGGVHTGQFVDFRRPGLLCPRCGSELCRATIGGRTTWWCPQEQF